MARDASTSAAASSLGAWREALKELGCTRASDGWAVQIEGVTVTFEVVPRQGDADVRVRAPLAEATAGMRVIRPEHALTDEGRFVTGDAALDRRAWIFCDDPRALSTLSANARRALVELFDAGAMCVSGAIVLEPWATAGLDAARAGMLVRRVARLVNLLSAPRGDKALERFARIVADDPDEAVRAAFAARAKDLPSLRKANARLAVDRAAVGDEATLATLFALLDDEGTQPAQRRDAWGKLVALFPPSSYGARLDGLDRATAEMISGHLVRKAQSSTSGLTPICEALMRLLERPGKGEASAAIGVAQVFGRARFGTGIGWLGRRVDLGQTKEVARAALAALMLMPHAEGTTWQAIPKTGQSLALELGGGAAVTLATGREPVGPLFAALCSRAREAEPAVGCEYMVAVREMGDARFAELAVGYLESKRNEVVVAALDALAVIGQPVHLRAVAPFAKGMFRASEVKAAAAAALVAMRERAPDEGGLALAGGEAGALALKDEGEGGP